jgi:hypothetical protein
VEPSEYVPVAASCVVVPAGTDGFVGVIAMLTRTPGVTERVSDWATWVVGSTTPIVVVPCVSAVTRPPGETVATSVADEVHVTVAVTSFVDPSVHVPRASSCPVNPAGTLGEAGERAMDASTAGVTVSAAVPVFLPLGSVAVIVALPAATPVARPALEVVAIVVAEEVHVTWPVMSIVDVSEYVPVAANCWDSPALTVAVGGVTATETSVALVTVIFEEPVVLLPRGVAVIVTGPPTT